MKRTAIKRSGLPPRKSPVKPRNPNKGLKRSSWITRSTKPIPKVNAKRKAKREKAYKSFLSSAKWKQLRKEALQRAGYQCETEFQFSPDISNYGMDYEWVVFRCPSTDRLHVDHLTYARFGGDELPEDLKVLCYDHHMKRHALEGKRIA
jgi:5-methylcytosine-specific restriction endonuclease McrA